MRAWSCTSLVQLLELSLLLGRRVDALAGTKRLLKSYGEGLTCFVGVRGFEMCSQVTTVCCIAQRAAAARVDTPILP